MSISTTTNVRKTRRFRLIRPVTAAAVFLCAVAGYSQWSFIAASAAAVRPTPKLETVTTDKVAKFANGSGTLTDSSIIDSGGNVGIGLDTNSPPQNTPKNTLDVNYGSTNVIPGISAGGTGGWGAGITLNNTYTAGVAAVLLNVNDSSKAYVAASDAKLLTLTTANVANSGWNVGVNINASGNVGVGTTTPAYTVDVAGTIHATGAITSNAGINAVFQDVAEWVPAAEEMSPATVVVLSGNRNNEVIASSFAYDTSVAGVVSAQPGILLGRPGAGKAQIATTGRVKVRVDARNAPIQIGDLLVTSDVRGTAMKSQPVRISGRRFHQPGTIIGKALEPLESGEGEILVLLSLQ
jgi:hypothetical protein